MAGFEYGEKLICLQQVKYGAQSFAAGSVFPYIDLNVEPGLLDSLLFQRKIAREAHVSPALLEELKVVRVEKIIRNFPDGRVAVSWPENEPLPEGVIDGRPKKKTEEEEPIQGEEPEVDMDSDLSDGDFLEDYETEAEEAHDDTDSSSVSVVPADEIGWFNVEVDGIVVNTKKLRKKAALKLSDEYR